MGPLARSHRYLSIDAALPKERTSLVYIDTARLAPLLDQLGQNRDGEGTALLRAGLRPIKAIGMASEPEKNGMVRGRLFVAIP
jgi:hypothetical protein